jgi:methylmalonyl-CoA mutase cobalamin-binding domain/chain
MELHKFDIPILQEIYSSIADIEVGTTSDLVEKALADKVNVLTIVDALTKGINTVGDKFEELECFLPEMMMAAEEMEKAMAIVQPHLDKLNLNEGAPGKVVIATIQGDIHDIGRNIVITMLRTSGFIVVDLGHDVKADIIIRKAEEVKADVIGLSSLLTTSLPFSRDMIDLLNELKLREKYIVVMGGAAVTPKFVEEIGADGYCADAARGVKVIRQLLEKR